LSSIKQSPPRSYGPHNSPYPNPPMNTGNTVASSSRLGRGRGHPFIHESKLHPSPSGRVLSEVQGDSDIEPIQKYPSPPSKQASKLLRLAKTRASLHVFFALQRAGFPYPPHGSPIAHRIASQESLAGGSKATVIVKDGPPK
jgi:hypothetical protein